MARKKSPKKKTAAQLRAIWAKKNVGKPHKGEGRLETSPPFAKPVRVWRRDRQIGETNKTVDKRIKALHPGKRTSEFGNDYYEYRKNRSDRDRSKNI